ncbi:MAG: PIN domain-containing protein [Armatimonadetes bacterium]|nr:PIN domain-containing protein [Armatimonadota bacterium]
MTPDVNVLVGALRTDLPEHPVAAGWLQAAHAACEQGETLVLLPMVAAGFLRVATHPRIFRQPSTIAEALASLDALLSAAYIRVLDLGLDLNELRRLCDQHQLAGNAVPDAWIAAATLANHEHLVTFDRGFRRYLPPNQLTLL